MIYVPLYIMLWWPFWKSGQFFIHSSTVCTPRALKTFELFLLRKLLRFDLIILIINPWLFNVKWSFLRHIIGKKQTALFLFVSYKYQLAEKKNSLADCSQGASCSVQLKKQKLPSGCCSLAYCFLPPLKCLCLSAFPQCKILTSVRFTTSHFLLQCWTVYILLLKTLFPQLLGC